jgi:N-acetyltransferase
MERLVGTKVRLDPLLIEDAEGYFAAAHSDEGATEVFHWLADGPPRTTRQAQEQIAAALTARTRGERLAYAQRDLTTGQFIGTTSLYEVSPAVRTLAIGHTWLGRRWWRTGHNTDSKLVLLTHAFDSLEAARVVWHTDILNTRSQAAIERLGARKEGVLRKHRIRPDGTWRDTVQYSMTDEEWPASRDRLMARLATG